jgi:hypothetical protein
MTFSGMAILIMRGPPSCARSSAHLMAVLALSASSLIGLARFHVPHIEVILMGWAAAVVVVLSVTREVTRQRLA